MEELNIEIRVEEISSFMKRLKKMVGICGCQIEFLSEVWKKGNGGDNHTNEYH
jgi:hypothetical protein